MNADGWPPPSCRFYLRTPVDGGHRYDMLSLKNAGREGGNLVTPYPPLTGDTLMLHVDDDRSGEYRVVARQWNHVAYGSAAWRTDATRPSTGPTLFVVVEPDAGMFHDQITDHDDEDGGNPA